MVINMKKFFGVLLRIACILVIALAIYTALRAILHMNDDHSEQALMGTQVTTQEEAAEIGVPEPTAAQPAQSVSEPMEEEAQESEAPAVEENPTVVLTVSEPAAAPKDDADDKDEAKDDKDEAKDDGEQTGVDEADAEAEDADKAGDKADKEDQSESGEPKVVTVTATFKNIVNSIDATITWLLDGKEEGVPEDRLLVEGSTVTFDVPLEGVEEDLPVGISVAFGDKTLTAETVILAPAEEPEEEITIQSAEIEVTFIEACSVYKDSNLDEEAGEEMEKDDTAILLDYGFNDADNKTLKVKLEDGTSGWVGASHCEISDKDFTTDEDYTDAQKEEFVNSMGYESKTGYLVWVSTYTQKVNIFSGEKGKWELEESFDCCTGKNETPTASGIFATTAATGSWDLADGTYVSPVIVFNGGEAFTSQPYNQDGEVDDDTIGKPATGGSVRLVAEDIEWFQTNVPAMSTVVIF